jgi:hypothetical protein
MEPSKAIRAGDTVLHKPTGEKWLVAAMSGDGAKLVCCGWPESIADVSDCELFRSATDEKHTDTLMRVIESCPEQLRGSWARQNLAAIRGGE